MRKGYGFGLQPACSNMASHERISQLVSTGLSFSVQIEPSHHSLLRIISKVKEKLFPLVTFRRCKRQSKA